MVGSQRRPLHGPPAHGGQGPFIGGSCLGKGNDSSETRLRAPIAARQSVHIMPLIAGWTELDEFCPTSYQRRKTGIVVKTEWCTKLKIVSAANKREAMEENIE